MDNLDKHVNYLRVGDNAVRLCSCEIYLPYYNKNSAETLLKKIIEEYAKNFICAYGRGIRKDFRISYTNFSHSLNSIVCMNNRHNILTPYETLSIINRELKKNYVNLKDFQRGQVGNLRNKILYRFIPMFCKQQNLDEESVKLFLQLNFND